MRLASLAAIGFLLGCSNEDASGFTDDIPERFLPTDEVAESFAEAGAVPDCATMQWATQFQSSDGFTQSARYVASNSCNEVWESSLTEAGFETWSPHGERVLLTEGQPSAMVTPPSDGARVVKIYSRAAMVGVEMFTPEEAND